MFIWLPIRFFSSVALLAVVGSGTIWGSAFAITLRFTWRHMRNAQVVVSCSLFLILVAGCGPSVRVKNAGVPTSQSVAPTGIWKAQGVADASPATESQEQQPSEILEFPPNALEAIHPLMPEYPQESQERGVEGPAVVELWIGTEGLVLNKPQIVVAPDQAIGESVVKAVSQWAFKKWRPEFPSKADKGREDLVFYFVLKNNKPMVVRYEGELPAGKTFPPFPRSLRERQTFNPENMLSWCRTDPANEIIGGQQPGAIPRVVCYYSTGDWSSRSNTSGSSLHLALSGS